LGILADVTTVATTNQGFRVDNTGNVLIKSNTSGTNYLKFGSGSLEINANTFALTTTNLSITSATPSIAMGSSLPTYNSGTGIWLGNDGGTYKAFIGASAGNKLLFDGTNLSITGAITATTGAIGG
jgi:hypothetical protein